MNAFAVVVIMVQTFLVALMAFSFGDTKSPPLLVSAIVISLIQLLTILENA